LKHDSWRGAGGTRLLVLARLTALAKKQFVKLPRSTQRIHPLLFKHFHRDIQKPFVTLLNSVLHFLIHRNIATEVVAE